MESMSSRAMVMAPPLVVMVAPSLPLSVMSPSIMRPSLVLRTPGLAKAVEQRARPIASMSPAARKRGVIGCLLEDRGRKSGRQLTGQWYPVLVGGGKEGSRREDGRCWVIGVEREGAFSGFEGGTRVGAG